MFGMGFTEILLIGIIAILFIGPDKLPETMVEIVKFFRNIKRTINSAKSSIENELHVTEMRKNMNDYKNELTSASSELNRLASMDDIKNEINDIKKESRVDIGATLQEPKTTPSASAKPEVVTFKKEHKTLQPDLKSSH
jgi:sec-independent protein translocase protein TatB